MTRLRTSFMSGRGLPGALAWLAGLVAVVAMTAAAGLHGAQAMQKRHETGSFDCSCHNGRGTCTFESSTDNTDCYKGAENTCTGSCMLTLTPDKPARAIRGRKAVPAIKAPATRAK